MTRRARVVGVLLAAGLGTRFEGGNKLLARVSPRSERDENAEPVVRLAARNLVGSPAEAPVAVLGHGYNRVASALDPVGIASVHNPNYEDGQATSVARGVAWARDHEADAALFALGDMPWVAAETYRTVIDRWRASGADIVVPEHAGKRGNPVLFDAVHFDALESVSGDVGGRELIARNPVERVAVDDPGIHRDVDRAADLDGGVEE
ncbi:MAG: NTP transferase domain-containing protein [Halolamina sp.]